MHDCRHMFLRNPGAIRHGGLRALPLTLVGLLLLTWPAHVAGEVSARFPLPFVWDPPAATASARSTHAPRPTTPSDIPALAQKRPPVPGGGDAATAPSPEELLAHVRARLDLWREADRWNLRPAVDAGFIVTVEAAADLGRLKAAQPGDARLRIAWHPRLGTPRFLAGVDLLPGIATPSDPFAAAACFLYEHRALLRIADPSSEFAPLRQEQSPDGFRAVRLQQLHQGLPVWGCDVLVRLDPAGHVIGFSGGYCPTPPVPLAAAPAIDQAQAQATALAALAAADRVTGEIESSELLYCPHECELRLAWSVTVRAGITYRKQAFIDALTGGFLRAVERVMRDAELGQGTDLQGNPRTLGLWEIDGTYYMIDWQKPMFDEEASRMPGDPRGAIWTLHGNHSESRTYQVTSTDPNGWSGRANAVSAATGAGYGYDFLNDVFARNSYDDAGRTITAVVDVGIEYNNAFWDGNVLAFGNGDGSVFSDLAGGLDVICHELGHAVVEHTANLIYEFQPGAMNEHFGDVFGALAEWYVADRDGGSADWWIGEDVTTPGIPGDCLRNMAQPDAANVYDPPSPHYPTHMDEYFNWPANQDYGGVHINNTILSRAFVMVCDDIGWAKAGQIWYRTLAQYLNRNSEFVDLRLGALQAAEDLYGARAGEVQAVTEAFDAVGVVGDEGTEEPPDLPDNVGDDYLAVMRPPGGHIHRAPLDWNGQGPIGDISGNVMGAGGRPSFSDDGLEMAWVDGGGDIFVAHSNGAGRRKITTNGQWWSVALGPDARHLAATTIHEDQRIYLFDLEEPGNDTYFELTTQNDSGGGGADNVVYADVMEFTVPGDFILYDTLNRAEVEGETIEYWDLNMLRLADGVCFRVFQQLPRGENVGNPTLAQNRDDLIAYDHVDAFGYVHVMAMNLTTGEVGLVTENGSQLGHPTFAGDDQRIYYQVDSKPFAGVWEVGLLADGITGAGDKQVWNYGVTSPVYFTIGVRPTPVRLNFLTGSWRGTTIALEWQAPESAVLAGYHVERSLTGGDDFERRTAEILPIADAGGTVCRFADDAPADAPALWYAVIGVGLDGGSTRLGVIELAPDRPRRAALRVTSGPNPFRGETTLRLQLPAHPGRTDIRIYDAQGRWVAWPVRDALLPAGSQALVWQARDLAGRPLAAGEYFLQLRSGRGRTGHRLVVIR